MNHYRDDLAISTDPEVGLTKREYAAIQAMNGLLAGAPRETSWDSLGFSNAAKWSVQVADALFDELEKESK